MTTTLITMAGAMVLIGLFFAFMNLKYYFFNGEHYKGGCAQNNPLIRNEIGDCQLCGKKADEACKMPEAH